MTIFGNLQALFKVAEKGTPGQPAKDESYVLSEGERQDEIEVVKINQADGTITFNNHGTIQELPLVAASPTSPAGGGPGMGAGINPGMTGRQMPMTPAERTAMMMQGRGTGGSASPGMNAGGSGAGFGTASPSQGGINYINSTPSQAAQGTSQVTPEQAALNMELQRAQWQKTGNPAVKIIPPPGPAMQKFINENGGSGAPNP